jgi:UDP-N-acetylglucosamine/UDP-N-acetylgalactosamine diphosphorylase
MDKAAMAAAFGAGGVNGIKLESFIFDVFPAARRMAVLEIERDAEFAPVKNAPGSAEDSPDTARALIARLHARWLRDAGATLLGDGAVEVSGAASYAGEGLTALAGRALQTPLLVRRAGEHGAAAAREGVTVVELDAE